MEIKTGEFDKTNCLKILIDATFQTNINNDKNHIKDINNRVEKYSH